MPGRPAAKGKRSTATELLRSIELLELRPHLPGQAPQASRNGVTRSLSAASAEPTYVFREFDHYSPEARQWATAYGDSVYFRDISFAVGAAHAHDTPVLDGVPAPRRRVQCARRRGART